MNKILGILSIIVALLCVSCGDKNPEGRKSDSRLEAMLAGVWINEDNESVVFKAVNDTLYYPDTDVLPVHYRIYGDSMYIDGDIPMKYFIEKLTSNVFKFRNQNQEIITLIKSNNPDIETAFGEEEEIFDDDIIQELVKRDTIVTNGDRRYHCYVQINPTTYKVIKSDYNDEGVGVSKMYYDNIIHLAVYEGAHKVFSSDIRKDDFHKYVPAEVMRQSILSDVVYDRCDSKGIVFHALLRVPESASGYIVFITISPNGKITLSQPE